MRWIGLWLKIKVSYALMWRAKKRELGVVVVGEPLRVEWLRDANAICACSWEGNIQA